MARGGCGDAPTRSGIADSPEGLLRVGFDAWSLGFAVFDADLRLVTSNEAFRVLRDYPERLNRPGTALAELYRFNARRGDYGPGDVGSQVAARLARARSREAHELEYELATGRTLRIRYAPLSAGGLILSYADVTELRTAEHALREQSRFLQLTETITRAANEAASVEEAMRNALIQVCTHTGWSFGRASVLDDSTEDLASTCVWSFDDAREHEEACRLTEALWRASHLDLRRQVLASGEPSWILDIPKDPNLPSGVPASGCGIRAASAFPVLVGAKVAAVLEFFAAEAVEAHEPLLNVMTQIGTQLGRVLERQRAEKALRESEARYALAMAGANEGMWDWTAGNDEVFVSESYKRLVGLDMPGDRMLLDDWVALIHPEDLAARAQAQRAHKEGYAAIYECEYRVRCGDGQYRWFLDRARSLRDDNGEIYRMAGSMTDVTARKQAERQLLEANLHIKEQNQTLELLSVQLSKYLSPQVYASIFSGQQTVEIASKRKHLTVFFSDICDFTETTDSLEPEETTGLLNHYLTEMANIALEHGATVDKYVGDAIMAFFGDPDTKGVKEDAIACVRMAIAMQRRMHGLQSEWREMGLENPFQLRIGINTGFCTVGNFGSEERMDYTIIGNDVNLAARLQSHARAGSILITHETYYLVKDTVLTEEQDPITVKGFARPVRTHKVVGIYDDLVDQGRIIRKEEEGLRMLVDLDKHTKESAIQAVEEFLSALRDRDGSQAQRI